MPTIVPGAGLRAPQNTRFGPPGGGSSHWLVNAPAPVLSAGATGLGL
ncbi:hypothetical protein [Amycolatopsis panacis]|nr:hypothetical protein [Amycolatopsis panacis]